MVNKEPCDALLEDHVEKLMLWKRKYCKIVLARDFNDDVYRDKTSEQLADADLIITEQILKTTGIKLPPTHKNGPKLPTGYLLLFASNTPEGVYPDTKMILSECSKMHVSMSREEVSTYVTTENSLYIRLHYDHYLAAADNEATFSLACCKHI